MIKTYDQQKKTKHWVQQMSRVPKKCRWEIRTRVQSNRAYQILYMSCQNYGKFEGLSFHTQITAISLYIGLVDQ